MPRLSPSYTASWSIRSFVFSKRPKLAASQPGQQARTAPNECEPWLTTLFPSYVSAPLAEHHRRIWQWVWALERGTRPNPLVVLLARGGAKSTTAELACVAVGARRARRYVLYISGKQAQADDHVANVAGMLESEGVASYYPALGRRSLNVYGASKGWRRNRLRTEAGLTVDSLGLDVAARGVKLDEQRPDLLIFDDVDDAEDSIDTVNKKVRAITQKLLPAGSPDMAALFVQNVVHYESVAARLAGLASVEADFLADREVIGPVPALVGFKAEPVPGSTRWRVMAGTPTWAGQDLQVCQQHVNDWGIRAFRAEAQHERTPPEGQAFPEFDASVHVCEPFAIPEAWPKWAAVDYGYAAPFGCLWLTQSPQGRIYVYRERYGTRLTAREQAYECRLASAGEDHRFRVGDPAMWATQREGQTFMSVADHYGEMGFALQPASNDRLAGKARVHDVLAWAPEAPPVLQIFKTCTNLMRTLPMLPVDPHKPEDVDTLAEDHVYDCLKYGLMAAHWLGTTKRQKPRDYTVGRGQR